MTDSTQSIAPTGATCTILVPPRFSESISVDGISAQLVVQALHHLNDNDDYARNVPLRMHDNSVTVVTLPCDAWQALYDSTIGYEVIMITIDHAATGREVRLVEGWNEGSRFDRSSLKLILRLS